MDELVRLFLSSEELQGRACGCSPEKPQDTEQQSLPLPSILVALEGQH